MSKVYVKDIQDKDKVDSIFMVGKKSLVTGKNGKPFLTLSLFDKTGEIDARVWENAAELDKAFNTTELVKVAATTVMHQGHVQLKIDSLEKTELGELPADDFAAPPAPATPKEPESGAGPGKEGGHSLTERRFAEVVALIDRVNDPHIRSLLRSFVDDPEISNLFKRAPAAKTIHHGYPGGLLEHTLSCMKLAHRLCDHYPVVDRDLVLAGAFLHDIGKTKELSFDRGTEYTDEGRLVGHLVMTSQWIHERARKIEGFPVLLEQHLVHLVLAHHGSLEYGSPKVPSTLEALVVHQLDELDSRINSWVGLMQRDGGDRWTDFSKLYERHLWKGPSPTIHARRPVESRSKRRHKVAPAQPGAEGAEGAPREGRAERPPREPREHREGREPREHREPREGRPERAERAERPERPPRGEKRPAKEERLTFKPFAAIASRETEPEPEPDSASARTDASGETAPSSSASSAESTSTAAPAAPAENAPANPTASPDGNAN